MSAEAGSEDIGSAKSQEVDLESADGRFSKWGAIFQTFPDVNVLIIGFFAGALFGHF